MLPEEQELVRLEGEQFDLEDQVGDLAKQLTVEISKRKSQLGTAVHGGNP